MITDRQIVEIAMLPRMMIEFVDVGLEGVNLPEVKTLKVLLDESLEELFSKLDRKKRASLQRRVERGYETTTAPYRKEDMRVDKFGLLVFWLIKLVTDCDYLILHEGSPMQKAMELALQVLEHRATETKLNESAKKAACKLLKSFQSEGYYLGVTLEA